MTIKIVMFSSTRLAGAPFRIAEALNKHPLLEVRLIDLKRWGTFAHDHVHEESPDISIELAEKADVIHLFNFLDANSNDFCPVDFNVLQKKGKQLIRMFESTPMFVAKRMGLPLDAVLYDKIPQLVIAQYPERFLPRARVVPNIIPQDSTVYLPSKKPTERAGIVFSPSWQHSAWAQRWDTKGLPETVAMMRKVSAATGVPATVINKQPFPAVMKAKRSALAVVDELITGSYHLSGLEGLALAKPVLVYLDGRTEYVLRTISGASELPFINARLEDASLLLHHLIKNELERHQFGEASRAWIDRYWRDVDLIEHYAQVYRDLLNDPDRIERQPELAIDSPSRKFFAYTHPDRIFEARKERWLKCERLPERVRRFYVESFRPSLRNAALSGSDALLRRFGQLKKRIR